MRKISVITDNTALYKQIKADILQKYPQIQISLVDEPQLWAEKIDPNEPQLLISDHRFCHHFLKVAKISSSHKLVSIMDTCEEDLPDYADFTLCKPLNRAILHQIVSSYLHQQKLTQELADLNNTSFFDRFICNKDLKILEAHAPNIQLYGVTAKKPVGQDLVELFPKLFFLELSKRIPQVLTSNQRQEFVTKGEIVNRKVWFYIYLKPLDNGNCKIIIKDVSNLNLSSHIHETLFEIANAVTTSNDMPELYSKIHQSLKKVLAADNFYIALVNEQDNSSYSPYFKDKRYEVETPIKLRNDGISSYVIRQKKALFIDSEIRSQLIEQGEIADYKSKSVSMLAAPLLIGKEAIGMIAIRSFSEKNIYTQNHLEILEFISQLIATSIAQKRTEKQINQAFEEKDTLLRELYHRTKNNMQVIISMLSIQSNTTDNKLLQSKFKEISTRISTMSLAHEKLYKSHDLTKLNLREYIQDLFRMLNRSYYIPKLKLEQQIEIADIPVSIDTALPLGLVLNELVSNTYHHAFQNSISGKISLSIQRCDEERLCLEYADNGVGLAADFDLEKSSKMGLNNFISTIKHQLKGSVDYDSSEGLKWSVTFYDNLYSRRI
ncbi:MAG: histidine kinase dimerization/phosphoacceptor domain -containing protein [Candidatus Cloacimonadales bacterium]